LKGGLKLTIKNEYEPQIIALMEKVRDIFVQRDVFDAVDGPDETLVGFGYSWRVWGMKDEEVVAQAEFEIMDEGLRNGDAVFRFSFELDDVGDYYITGSRALLITDPVDVIKAQFLVVKNQVEELLAENEQRLSGEKP
jgi:hypothetical protein